MDTSKFVLQCVAVVLLTAAATGCNVLTDAGADPVVFDKTIVADAFGDHNGTATAGEIQFVDEYFAANGSAWCITGLASTEVRDVFADEVKQAFSRISTRPYTSEQELRTAYAGISIRTPYVGIMVLRGGGRITVAQYYRAPGPGVGAAQWELLSVK